MGTRPWRAVWCGILGGLGASVAACAQTTTAPGAGAAPPAAGAAATQPALDPEIDKILTRLEQRDVRDLHAKLSWRQHYVTDLEEDDVTKTGEIRYKKGTPVARFLIKFTEKLANNRKDKLDEQHLFDGCWYTELQSRTKTVVRREIRRPDDAGDPYKVGQGVFPLPFGQKKAEILREFEVERVPPAANDPPATDHVRLLPREQTRTGETYKQLDFWIDREGPTAGLPIKVQVAKKDGTGKLNSYITITFGDAKLNQGFSDSVFEIKVPLGYTEAPPEPLEPIAPATEGPARAP